MRKLINSSTIQLSCLDAHHINFAISQGSLFSSLLFNSLLSFFRFLFNYFFPFFNFSVMCLCYFPLLFFFLSFFFSLILFLFLSLLPRLLPLFLTLTSSSSSFSHVSFFYHFSSLPLPWTPTSPFYKRQSQVLVR